VYEALAARCGGQCAVLSTCFTALIMLAESRRGMNGAAQGL
jgi:hypothetical protein